MGQSLKPSPWWKTEHCNRPASYILLDHKSTNLFILIEFKAKWRTGHVEYVSEDSGKKASCFGLPHCVEKRHTQGKKL